MINVKSCQASVMVQAPLEDLNYISVGDIMHLGQSSVRENFNLFIIAKEQGKDPELKVYEASYSLFRIWLK